MKTASHYANRPPDELASAVLNRKGTTLLPFLQEWKLPNPQLHQSDA
jgi:hypothetical protein